MKNKKNKKKIIGGSILLGTSLVLSACAIDNYLKSTPQTMYGAALPTENIINEEDTLVTTMYGVEREPIVDIEIEENLPTLMYGVQQLEEKQSLSQNSISNNEVDIFEN